MSLRQQLIYIFAAKTQAAKDLQLEKPKIWSLELIIPQCLNHFKFFDKAKKKKKNDTKKTKSNKSKMILFQLSKLIKPSLISFI